jgi:hypothetical protein
LVWKYATSNVFAWTLPLLGVIFLMLRSRPDIDYAVGTKVELPVMRPPNFEVFTTRLMPMSSLALVMSRVVID